MKSYLNQYITFFLLLLSSYQAYGDCKVNIYDDSTLDVDSATIQMGHINLNSNYLQPVGTVVGTTAVSPITSKNVGSSTLLMTCDYSDRNDIYELFATNGDDRVGGYWEVGTGKGGNDDGMPGYYATWFPYVALKVIHNNSGLTLSRYWQKWPIKDYVTSDDKTKIYIRGRHLSTYTAQLAKVSTRYASTGSKSDYCSKNPSDPSWGSSISISDPFTYTCGQPNFYVQVYGPGVSSAYRDYEGEDSATHYDFWGDNGVSFRLKDGLTMSFTPTCVVKNYTPVVLFPTVSVKSLEAGDTFRASLSLSLECNNDVDSGISTNQTALGFMVDENAYNAADSLGLISGGGVQYLVSDNYATDDSMAQNVGIRLWDSKGTNIPFVSPYTYSATGKRTGGWVPVLENVESMGSAKSGYTSYIKQLTATLEKLPNTGSVTAGKVDAHARIIIKVQ